MDRKIGLGALSLLGARSYGELKRMLKEGEVTPERMMEIGSVGPRLVIGTYKALGLTVPEWLAGKTSKEFFFAKKRMAANGGKRCP